MKNNKLTQKQVELEERIHNFYVDYRDEKISKDECNFLVNKDIEDGYKKRLLSKYDYESFFRRINRNGNGTKRTFVDWVNNLYYNYYVNEERIFKIIFSYFEKNSKTPVSYRRLEGDNFKIYIANLAYRDDNPFASDYKVCNFNSKDILIEIKKFHDVHEFKLNNMESYVKNGSHLFVENTLSEKYYFYSPTSLSKIIKSADNKIIDYKGQKYILISDGKNKKNKNNKRISFLIDELKKLDYVREYDKEKSIFLKNNVN